MMFEQELRLFAMQNGYLKMLVADLPRPLFLMGDFNLPGGWPRRLTGFTSLATGATYPSVAPRVQCRSWSAGRR